MSALFRSLGSLATIFAVFAAALVVMTSSNASPNATPTPVPAVAEENPIVAPGLVNWHPSFADAQVAAQKSGKPVFLFHMMGELDRQFC